MLTMAWIMFVAAVSIVAVGVALLVIYALTGKEQFRHSAAWLLVPAALTILACGVLLDQGSQDANESRAILVQEYIQQDNLQPNGIKGVCRVDGEIVTVGPLRFRVVVQQVTPQGEKEN